MRTNSHGIGTRVIARDTNTRVVSDETTPDAELGQLIGPLILGLGERVEVDLLHLSWSDGVMQCELNVTVDQKRAIAENNCKAGSCPVLFTWNVGGGLGCLVAPGVYSQPDRDEAVAIRAK